MVKATQLAAALSCMGATVNSPYVADRYTVDPPKKHNANMRYCVQCGAEKPINRAFCSPECCKAYEADGVHFHPITGELNQ